MGQRSLRLADLSRAIVERYIYDPYGLRSVLDASFKPRSPSSYGWVYGHQGGRLDVDAGLYNFRYRDLSPTLMRWNRVDPIRYQGRDGNLYRVEGNGPVNRLDPLGLLISLQGCFANPSAALVCLETGVISASAYADYLAQHQQRIADTAVETAQAMTFLPAIWDKVTEWWNDLVYRAQRAAVEAKERARILTRPRLRPDTGRRPQMQPRQQPSRPNGPPSQRDDSDRGPCEFYYAWCKHGVLHPDELEWPETWTQRIGDCARCYAECQANGNTPASWPFEKCPIAGGLDNDKGPRWPCRPDDAWPPVFPD